MATSDAAGELRFLQYYTHRTAQGVETTGDVPDSFSLTGFVHDTKFNDRYEQVAAPFSDNLILYSAAAPNADS